MLINSLNEKNKSSLLIYIKYLKLIYFTNDILQKYPKSEKFALVKEIKNTLYNGLCSLMYAIKTNNEQEKTKYLSEFDLTINLLKKHIELSYRYKYINLQNYTIWYTLVKTICQIISKK